MSHTASMPQGKKRRSRIWRKVDGALTLVYMTKGGRKSAVQVLIESYKTEGKSRYYE